jgi:hypothetical protein
METNGDKLFFQLSKGDISKGVNQKAITMPKYL